MIDVVKLVQYNTWANKRIAEQVMQLSNEQFIKEVGGSFPSIRLTLLHVLTSDWVWMHRFKGIPLIDVPEDWRTDDAHAMYAIWMPVQNEMERIAKDLAANPDQLIAFTNKKGINYTLPFADIVLHVTNHGTYHRGQIVNMIRMLGEQPVNTDYFIFCTSNDK